MRTSGDMILGRLWLCPKGMAKPDTENDPMRSPPLRGSGREWKQGGRFPLHALAGGLPLPMSADVADVGSCLAHCQVGEGRAGRGEEREDGR